MKLSDEFINEQLINNEFTTTTSLTRATFLRLMNGSGICLDRFILHGFLSQHTRFETKPHKEDLDIVFCVYVKGHLTRKQTHM